MGRYRELLFPLHSGATNTETLRAQESHYKPHQWARRGESDAFALPKARQGLAQRSSKASRISFPKQKLLNAAILMLHFLTVVCSQTEVNAQHQYETILRIQSIRLPAFILHHHSSWRRWWLLISFHTIAQISPMIAHGTIGTTPR